MNSHTVRRHWPLALLIAIAAVWLYRTPYSAGDLEIPPDTVEYAVAPLQLLDSGHYQIVVQGRPLPPRYAPWFSTLIILPAFVIFGHDIGNAILPITALAVLGAVFAYFLGVRVGGFAGGLLGGLTLLLLPSYNNWAKQVMTDIPCTVLMLGTAIIYLRIRAKPASPTLYLGAGALVALATLFRPVFAAMLLPFLIEIVRCRLRLILLSAAVLLPIAIAAAANFTYNAATFGTPFRNGYQFWAAVPVDYPAMMFSLANVKMNAVVLLGTAFPLLFVAGIVAWFLARWRGIALSDPSRNALRDLLAFVIITTGPILVFHLLYFFPSDRFHLPLLAGGAVVTGALWGHAIGSNSTRLWKLVLPLLLLLAIAARTAVPEPLPHRRLAADRVRKYTPDNSIVISAIDPVYLEQMAGGRSARRIMPISRDVEYASKVLAWKRVDHPQPAPRDWRDGRALGLRRAGDEEAVKFVASEQLDQLASEVARATPVFLESTFAADADARIVTEIGRRFSLVRRAAYLYELRPLSQ